MADVASMHQQPLSLPLSEVEMGMEAAEEDIMEEEEEEGEEDPETLDLSGQDLEKLTRAAPEWQLNTMTLILDHNNLQRLDNIHTFQCIEKVGMKFMDICLGLATQRAVNCPFGKPKT